MGSNPTFGTTRVLHHEEVPLLRLLGLTDSPDRRWQRKVQEAMLAIQIAIRPGTKSQPPEVRLPSAAGAAGLESQ